MGQRNGFGSGFVAGAFLGGIVGGVLGALAASRWQQKEQDEGPLLGKERDIEQARQNLEDKISQLNLAIEDVREHMGHYDLPSFDHED